MDKPQLGVLRADFMMKCNDGAYASFGLINGDKNSFIEITFIDYNKNIVSGKINLDLIEAGNTSYLGRTKEFIRIRDLKFEIPVK